MSTLEILVNKFTISLFMFLDEAVLVDSLRCFIAADRRAQFEKLEYTEDDYEKELEHIEQVKP